MSQRTELKISKIAIKIAEIFDKKLSNIFTLT